MFNHLIPLCWNTTTELLEVLSCQRARMFWSTSIIRYSVRQWRNTSAGARLHGEACMQISALCLGLLWRSHPRQSSIHAAAWRMLWIQPWQFAINPEAWRGTGNSWLLVDWSGAWDFPTRLKILLIRPILWLERASAPLHTRERREGAAQAYCRSWRKVFRGDSLPLNWENSINYLCWQMFTDPNMHEFVELAGFP